MTDDPWFTDFCARLAKAAEARGPRRGGDEFIEDDWSSPEQAWHPAGHWHHEEPRVEPRLIVWDAQGRVLVRIDE
jgi:hypothetical protein